MQEAFHFALPVDSFNQFVSYPYDFGQYFERRLDLIQKIRCHYNNGIIIQHLGLLSSNAHVGWLIKEI